MKYLILCCENMSK